MYEALYAQNKGLLIAMARQYAALCAMDRAVSEEDLVQSGFLGLIRAAERYDPSQGKSWAGWAAWHIQREFDRALGRREGRFIEAHSGAVTLDCPTDAEDRESPTVGELLPDETLPPPDAGLLLEELRRDVREAVDRLRSDGQRDAVRLCQLEERSHREAAAAMGTSVYRLKRLKAKAYRRLAQDWRLRRLVDLDERTRFHAHKGVAAFNRDWTSVTEGAALWRIGQERGDAKG